MGKRPAVIFDIDGTLASIRWRLDPYLAADKSPDAKKAFHDGAALDAPVPAIRALAQALYDGSVAVLVVTARSDAQRSVTEQWLDRHGVQYHRLYMTHPGDRRDDAVQKHEIYHDSIEPLFDVRLVIEDRPHVVAMWEELGIPVLAVTDPHLSPLELENA